MVVPKIQIYDIQEENTGNSVKSKNEEDGYTVVFAVNEEEYDSLTDAIKEGVLDIRIYVNEKQLPSEKTYVPSGSIKQG